MTDDKPRRLPRFSLRSVILLVALAGSGYGLWAKWEPWVLRASTRSPDLLPSKLVMDAGVGFSDDDTQFIAWVSSYGSHGSITTWRAFDLDSREWGSANTTTLTEAVMEPAGTETRDGKKALRLVMARNMIGIDEVGEDNILFLIPAYHVSEISTFSNRGDFLAICSTPNVVDIYARRRPEYWWGVAWLPEFWLTLALGIGLLWSVWRDRKGLKTKA